MLLLVWFYFVGRVIVNFMICCFVVVALDLLCFVCLVGLDCLHCLL